MTVCSLVASASHRAMGRNVKMVEHLIQVHAPAHAQVSILATPVKHVSSSSNIIALVVIVVITITVEAVKVLVLIMKEELLLSLFSNNVRQTTPGRLGISSHCCCEKNGAVSGML